MVKDSNGLELGYLGDTQPAPTVRSGQVVDSGKLGSDFYGKPKAGTGGRTHGSVMNTLIKSTQQPTPKRNEVEMKVIKVKSNHSRGRIDVQAGGKLMLHFDQYGIAVIPEHKRELLAALQRSRPGRYREVLDEPEKKPAPKPVEVKAKVVKETKVKVEEVKAEEASKPKKKKSEKKKSTKKKKKKSFVEKLLGSEDKE